MARGLSIHIGLNGVNPQAYDGQWQGTLTGAVQDAQDMFAIAQAQGYQARLLLNAQATRQAMLTALSEASQQLIAGDMLLLTYAGHGGVLPDVSGDESDGIDETWCLYDGHLIDDELGLAWTRFAQGVRILVVSDSCHSGTMTRGVLGMPRSMPRSVAVATWQRQRGFYTTVFNALYGLVWKKPSVKPAIPPSTHPSGNPNPPLSVPTPNNAAVDSSNPVASVRLLAACAEDQAAFDGKTNGFFTQTLKAVWQNGQFHGDYAAFYDQLYQKMRLYQLPQYTRLGADDAAFDAQKPFQI